MARLFLISVNTNIKTESKDRKEDSICVTLGPQQYQTDSTSHCSESQIRSKDTMENSLYNVMNLETGKNTYLDMFSS